jgi:hypothetical protein
MTVGQLLREIDSHELSEWMAYAEIEPFGEPRADLRNAMSMALYANSVRGPKNKKVYKPADFMPTFDAEPPDDEIRWKSNLAFVEMLNTAMGGRDLRKT